MVASLLVDTLVRPDTVLGVPLTLVADLVPIGPRLCLLLWISVLVSLPEKLKLTCLPLLVKGARSFSGIVMAHLSFNS